MRHFRLPLIVTGIVVTLVMIIGLATLIWIGQLNISSRQKAERATKLGTGAGVLTGIVVAPFWLVAAAKVGKERRAAREAGR